jgi:hypothetical protein
MVMKKDSIVFAQVPLLRSQLEELKRRSGTTTTKDALQTAVTHYLRCPTMQQASASGEEGTTGASKAPKKSEGVGEEKDWWWSPEERAKI